MMTFARLRLGRKAKVRVKASSEGKGARGPSSLALFWALILALAFLPSLSPNIGRAQQA